MTPGFCCHNISLFSTNCNKIETPLYIFCGLLQIVFGQRQKPQNLHKSYPNNLHGLQRCKILLNATDNPLKLLNITAYIPYISLIKPASVDLLITCRQKKQKENVTTTLAYNSNTVYSIFLFQQHLVCIISHEPQTSCSIQPTNQISMQIWTVEYLTKKQKCFFLYCTLQCTAVCL